MTDTNRMTMILEKDVSENDFTKRLDGYIKNYMWRESESRGEREREREGRERERERERQTERERENVERRILSARALKSPSHLSFPCLKYFPRGFYIYIYSIYMENIQAASFI